MIYLTSNGEIYDHMINIGNITNIRGHEVHDIKPLIKNEVELIVIVDGQTADELIDADIYTTILDIEVTGSLPKLKHNDVLILKTDDRFMCLNIN